MPNWCSNYVIVSHNDTSKLKALAESATNGEFCNFIYPIPNALKETVSGSVPVDQEEAHNAQIKSNEEKYGYSDWYSFCVNEWGTKWDITPYADNIEPTGNIVEFGFDSAWSPPIALYSKMIDQGYTVKAYYYESGMGFCGKLEDGVDDYYELSNMSSAEVRNMIPRDLDDRFDISEFMADMEAEQADEE